MYLNPVLNSKQPVKEVILDAPKKPVRKERSDKIKDLKIPLTGEEWGFLKQYRSYQAKKNPQVSLTESNTQLLISVLLEAERNPDLIPEGKYDPKCEFVTCKPTVYYRIKLDELCVLWNIRSVRRVAHRLMQYAISRERGRITCGEN